MTVRQTCIAVFAPLVIAACAGDSSDNGPVSEGEAAALDEAARMLDEKRLPEGALPNIDSPETDIPADEADSNEVPTD